MGFAPKSENYFYRTSSTFYVDLLACKLDECSVFE